MDWSYIISLMPRATLVLAIVTGVIAGIANTALIAIVSAGLASDAPSNKNLALYFLLLCLVAAFSRFASTFLLARLGQEAVFELRVQLSKSILAAPLRRLEEHGSHRLLASLTDDVFAITNAVIGIPGLCMNSLIVVGTFIYLGWLSPTVSTIVLCFMVLGVLSYQLIMRRAAHSMKLARERQDALFKHFRAVAEGTKELKLHVDRREAFLSECLQSSAEAVKRLNTSFMTTHSIANNWGQTLFFIIIGALLLTPVMLKYTDHHTLVACTLGLLFTSGPLGNVINTLPMISRAGVSLRKLNSLQLSPTHSPIKSESEAEGDSRPRWARIDLSGVTHRYSGEGGESEFMLGPLDLTFFAGEMVFITGGNGSGKTTLAKVLTGLYVPEAGEIRVDGKRIGEGEIDSYRQNFSAVFSDFYLFDDLLGLDSDDLQGQAKDYLIQLRLDSVVKLEDARFSTLSLSQGQRKRLALLSAYLEDRPIYVFDEWAADQDPVFKQVFYCQILPKLKSSGKTVLVISHDERYYGAADRILRLDYGRVEYDSRAGIGLVAEKTEVAHGLHEASIE